MFRDALSNIVEKTEGATGALIMGIDGIAVEKVFLPEGSEANMDVAGAEVTSLVRSALRAGSDTGLGSLRELVVCFEGIQIVARLFTPDYFIVLTLGPAGNLGRGRYELRKAELRLSREFAL